MLWAYPQNFNQDQPVVGYDAWSLWNTGRVQHGERLPVYFRTFNDYVPPAANYITVPFIDRPVIKRPPGCNNDPYRVYFVTHTKPTGAGWQLLTAVKNKTGDPVWWAVTHEEQPSQGG